MELSLSRARFDELARPVVRASLESAEEALGEAGLGWAGLDALLLVGGGARMPVVAELTGAAYGAEPLRLARPEEAVALGAALRAQQQQELEFGGRDI